MLNRIEIDVEIMNKQIAKYRKTQERLLDLAVSNKKLAETRDGLKAIKAVMKGGEISETD